MRRSKIFEFLQQFNKRLLQILSKTEYIIQRLEFDLNTEDQSPTNLRIEILEEYLHNIQSLSLIVTKISGFIINIYKIGRASFFNDFLYYKDYI